MLFGCSSWLNLNKLPCDPVEKPASGKGPEWRAAHHLPVLQQRVGLRQSSGSQAVVLVDGLHQTLLVIGAHLKQARKPQCNCHLPLCPDKSKDKSRDKEPNRNRAIWEAKHHVAESRRGRQMTEGRQSDPQPPGSLAETQSDSSGRCVQPRFLQLTLHLGAKEGKKRKKKKPSVWKRLFAPLMEHCERPKRSGNTQTRVSHHEAFQQLPSHTHTNSLPLHDTKTGFCV